MNVHPSALIQLFEWQRDVVVGGCLESVNSKPKQRLPYFPLSTTH